MSTGLQLQLWSIASQSLNSKSLSVSRNPTNKIRHHSYNGFLPSNWIFYFKFSDIIWRGPTLHHQLAYSQWIHSDSAHRNRGSLSLPYIHKKSSGRRVFPYRASSLWTQLPVHFREISHWVSVFKSKHEAHLISQQPTIFHNYYPASHSFPLSSLLLRALQNPLLKGLVKFGLVRWNPPSPQQQMSNHILEGYLVSQESFYHLGPKFSGGK